jgi:hypothetical protein
MDKHFCTEQILLWLGIPETMEMLYVISPGLIGVSGDTELVRVALGTYLPAITTHTRYMMKAIFCRQKRDRVAKMGKEYSGTGSINKQFRLIEHFLVIWIRTQVGKYSISQRRKGVHVDYRLQFSRTP